MYDPLSTVGKVSPVEAKEVPRAKPEVHPAT